MDLIIKVIVIRIIRSFFFIKKDVPLDFMA